jgi:hypothetical protein
MPGLWPISSRQMGNSSGSLSSCNDRRRRRRGARIIAAVARLGLIAGLAIGGWDLLPRTAHKSAQDLSETSEHVVGPAIREKYPLSLIPGGLASDAELEAARAADPVLAEHYADVGFLHAAFMPHDQRLYASYRQGRSIVWTSARILVRATELVLVDRSGNMVRGRCGNRLSDTPRLPAAFVQPPEVVSETPEIAFLDVPSLPQSSVNDAALDLFPPFPAVEPPDGGPGIRPVPTTVTVTSGWPAARPFDSGRIIFSPVPTPIPTPAVVRPALVPEPGSALLLVAGGIIILARLRFGRQRD